MSENTSLRPLDERNFNDNPRLYPLHLGHVLRGDALTPSPMLGNGKIRERTVVDRQRP